MMLFLVVLAVCCLSIFTIFAVLLLLMNGTPYAIPFAMTAPAVVAAGLILLLNKYFTRWDRILWFLGISAASLLITGFVPVKDFYEGNLPKVAEEANFIEYDAFSPSTKAEYLKGGAALTLEGRLPKIDGATAYYPMYAAFVQAVYPEGNYENFTGDGTVLTEHPRYAYHRLLTGDRDVIFAPAPTASQLKRAEEAGLPLHLTLVAKEAFVFYVPSGNRISSLTEQEIRGIYSGSLTEWRDVGGRKQPIIAYQRKTESRSQQEMERIMDGTAFAPPPTEPVSEFSNGIVQVLAEYRNSKGALGYSYQNTAQGLADQGKLKFLEIDGVPPGPKEIRSGAYPYTQDIYAVTAGSANPNTDKMIDWILSEEGQQLVEQSGFTPIRIVK